MERVAIDSVHFDPANARKHNEKNMAAIKGSLARFGQQTERFFTRIQVDDNGCWNFSDIQPHTGYGKFHSNGVTWRAHRWVMWATGRISSSDKMCVLHQCDNRACVNPDHMKLGDRYDNAQDLKNRGRSHLIRSPKLGSKNPSAKLCEKVVLDIRAAIKSGEMGKSVAARYGVSSTTISEIKSGKVWGHI